MGSFKNLKVLRNENKEKNIKKKSERKNNLVKNKK